MAQTFNELLVSDMTLSWPAPSDGTRTVAGAMAPYSWVEAGDAYHDKPARCEAACRSFIPSLNMDYYHHGLSSFPTDVPQNINTSCSAQAHHQQQHQRGLSIAKGPSLWYNYCKSLVDVRTEWLASVPGEKLYQPIPDAKTVTADEEDAAIEPLLPCERSVKGLFVHPQILAGFRYIVRQADAKKPMFKGRALRLVSIGRGYGKRLTFESESRVSNDNYFYSDTNPAGYGFRLVAVQEEDKFTLRDSTGTAVGFAFVTQVNEEVELTQKVRDDNQVEKRVRVRFDCSLELFASGSGSRPCSVVGRAVVVRGSPTAAAQLEKIVRCKIDGDDLGYRLFPGINETERVSLVSGGAVGDIPASYIVKGLYPRELPVIGTFVHPNIMTGAKYKVRCLDSNKSLFGGAALTLKDIGRGYGKRITFQGESLLCNDNYFYSDTCEEGYGFTLEALSVGDQFRMVTSDGCDAGLAEVFRADVPQVQRVGRATAEACVAVTVTCHFSGLRDYPDCTTSVAGEALLKKSRSGVTIVSVDNLSFGGLLTKLSQESLQLVPR